MNSIPMIFDAGLKIVFTASNGEQRATQLCESNPDQTVRIGPRTVRALCPIKLTFVDTDSVPPNQSGDVHKKAAGSSVLSPE